jgi:DNA-binding MarR family transcriptional regulator
MKKREEIPNFPEVIHPALKDAFGYRFMHAALKYRKSLLVILDDYGLNPAQYSIMRILSDSNQFNQAALGKELGHDKVSMMRLIDGLESLDFIKRISSMDDKREKLIQITKSGNSALLKIKKRNMIREKSFLSPLSANEAVLLKKIIMKL